MSNTTSLFPLPPSLPSLPPHVNDGNANAGASGGTSVSSAQTAAVVGPGSAAPAIASLNLVTGQPSTVPQAPGKPNGLAIRATGRKTKGARRPATPVVKSAPPMPAPQTELEDTAEMQYLNNLVAQAAVAKTAGYSELAKLDGVLEELTHIKEVDMPCRPDLSSRVLQSLDAALAAVGWWRTEVAASGPQAGTSAPPQASPTTVATATVKAVPVASGSNVALSTGCGVAATAGQQVSLTPPSCPSSD
jgi:hypothetical protein